MKPIMYKLAILGNYVMLTTTYRVVLVIADKISETFFGICIGNH